MIWWKPDFQSWKQKWEKNSVKTMAKLMGCSLWTNSLDCPLPLASLSQERLPSSWAKSCIMVVKNKLLSFSDPDTLTKMTLRSPSTSLSLPPNKLSSSSGHCTYCGHGSSGPMGSQEGLVCSFCGNGVSEQVSSPTEEVEEGKSKLSRGIFNTIMIKNIWNCINF